MVQIIKPCSLYHVAFLHCFSASPHLPPPSSSSVYQFLYVPSGGVISQFEYLLHVPPSVHLTLLIRASMDLLALEALCPHHFFLFLVCVNYLESILRSKFKLLELQHLQQNLGSIQHFPEIHVKREQRFSSVSAVFWGKCCHNPNMCSILYFSL